MLPKKDKKMLVCPRCGCKDKNMEKAQIKEIVGQDEKKIDVVDKEIEAYPLTEAECPKCKHKKAYFWEVQTRASDEPATKFLKCEKCKHIWRDYS